MYANTIEDPKRSNKKLLNNTWIEINRERLKHNVTQIQSILPPNCKMACVVKANAYGHDAVLIAKELNSIGIYKFCVATMEEAIQLRKHDLAGDILILGYTNPEQSNLLYRYNLTQTVISLEYAKLLNKSSEKINVHICVDSGMHRYGERCEDIQSIAEIFNFENLNITGMYTHLCVSDSFTQKDKAYTHMQYQFFIKMISKLKLRGIQCPLVHIQATNGLLNYPQMAGDYARIGSGIYGLLLSSEDAANCKIDLKPILSLKSRVALVKTIMKHESVGYGLKFTAKNTSKIAVLPIGYSDGYFKDFSCGVGKVIINGQYAPVVGNICMNGTIVDVTHIPQIKAGDIATLIGTSQDKQISAYELAENIEMYPQEMLCYLSDNLERIVV